MLKRAQSFHNEVEGDVLGLKARGGEMVEKEMP